MTISAEASMRLSIGPGGKYNGMANDYPQLSQEDKTIMS